MLMGVMQDDEKQGQALHDIDPENTI